MHPECGKALAAGTSDSRPSRKNRTRSARGSLSHGPPLSPGHNSRSRAAWARPAGSSSSETGWFAAHSIQASRSPSGSLAWKRPSIRRISAARALRSAASRRGSNEAAAARSPRADRASAAASSRSELSGRRPIASCRPTASDRVTNLAETKPESCNALRNTGVASDRCAADSFGQFSRYTPPKADQASSSPGAPAAASLSGVTQLSQAFSAAGSRAVPAAWYASCPRRNR